MGGGGSAPPVRGDLGAESDAVVPGGGGGGGGGRRLGTGPTLAVVSGEFSAAPWVSGAAAGGVTMVWAVG
jgi:hypothetical protein